MTPRRIVLDASPGADTVIPGMPLQEAQARCKSAILLEADISSYRSAFDRVLDALARFSPVVEDGGLGLAYVDLTGLEGMYGGEARLIASLLNAVPTGYVVQAGIADSKFPVYVAATMASYSGAFRVPAEVRSFLADVSVELLPVSWDMIARLQGFGLSTLGQVAAVEIGPLQAQFGPLGRLMWELACGIDRRPVVARRVEETVVEEMDFPAPMASLAALLVATESLLGRAFLQPILRGRYVRAALLEGDVFRGVPWHRRIPFKEPVGSKARAYEVLKGTLAPVVLPGPLESLRITLSGLTGERGQQGSFFSDVRQRQQLRDALVQLEVRLGKPPPIFAVRELEPWSRIPERRHALVPYAP